MKLSITGYKKKKIQYEDFTWSSWTCGQKYMAIGLTIIATIHHRALWTTLMGFEKKNVINMHKSIKLL